MERQVYFNGWRLCLIKFVLSSLSLFYLSMYKMLVMVVKEVVKI